MTRARAPKQRDVDVASRDRRFVAALSARHLVGDPEWRESASCLAARDPELFYPVTSGWNETPFKPALRLCSGCPVTAVCLATALTLRDGEGVWGETTPLERRAMVVAWGQAAEKRAAEEQAAEQKAAG